MDALLQDRSSGFGEPLNLTSTRDERRAFYESYITHKAWDGAASQHEDEAFALEMRRAGIMPPAAILEIGFGEGRFLDWSRRQGFSVQGVELIEELVLRARTRGHRVMLGHLESVIDPEVEQFDIIVAFDVFEHFTPTELVALLRFVRRLLKPHGRVLARFPNGASPFGAYYQASDVTHAVALSPVTISQIAMPAGMRVVSVQNAARPLHCGRRHRLVRRAGYLARDAIEWVVGQIYFGRRVALDPMLTAVLARDPPQVAAGPGG
ncbi:MAG TPA: class I SAM-dependent methyltransferase [Acetobacteraceae bacterium]|nr:class I SAM-dependent methyltransferase [Acetobacteraceae bacterium]